MSAEVYYNIEMGGSGQAHGSRLCAATEMAQKLAWASGLRPENSTSIGHEH